MAEELEKDGLIEQEIDPDREVNEAMALHKALKKKQNFILNYGLAFLIVLSLVAGFAGLVVSMGKSSPHFFYVTVLVLAGFAFLAVALANVIRTKIEK